MDFHQTEIKGFIETFQFFNKKVPIEPVKRSYISVGSHLFIKFGEELDGELPNGRPIKKSPWTIWIGANVDWRLSQNGKFITGSCQPYEKMNAQVQKLIGKKYLSSSIISQLMDIQFEFEDGYVLTSFLSILLREQWTLFCENDNTAGLEAEHIDQVKQIRTLSSHFTIENLFKEIPLPINQKALTNFSLEGTKLYLLFDGHLTLCLDRCSWRVEKKDEYCIGANEFTLDEHPNIDPYLDDFKGKKLIKSSVVDPFQDARFEFEDGYVIKTFSCLNNQTPWKILKDNQKKVYSANVPLANV
ncbi:MAG: hypothetical protein S4CHLAM7_11250 [Chlamydiae bacterium]|nr:hypothetical protein [Chlamydiota bacterium]